MQRNIRFCLIFFPFPPTHESVISGQRDGKKKDKEKGKKKKKKMKRRKESETKKVAEKEDQSNVTSVVKKPTMIPKRRLKLGKDLTKTERGDVQRRQLLK